MIFLAILNELANHSLLFLFVLGCFCGTLVELFDSDRLALSSAKIEVTKKRQKIRRTEMAPENMMHDTKPVYSLIITNKNNGWVGFWFQKLNFQVTSSLTFFQWNRFPVKTNPGYRLGQTNFAGACNLLYVKQVWL